MCTSSATCKTHYARHVVKLLLITVDAGRKGICGRASPARWISRAPKIRSKVSGGTGHCAEHPDIWESVWAHCPRWMQKKALQKHASRVRSQPCGGPNTSSSHSKACEMRGRVRIPMGFAIYLDPRYVSSQFVYELRVKKIATFRLNLSTLSVACGKSEWSREIQPETSH